MAIDVSTSEEIPALVIPAHYTYARLYVPVQQSAGERPKGWLGPVLRKNSIHKVSHAGGVLELAIAIHDGRVGQQRVASRSCPAWGTCIPCYCVFDLCSDTSPE